ncbi:MAG: hypothetical protein NE330_20650, partial [Lentisphaeraceae bacterium]|nr:hypothetical protein [Lentisphaeraceae bacterium]
TVAIENVETNDAALEDTNDEAPSTDDDSTIEAVSDVVVSPSAFASPNVYGGRSAAGRAASVSKFGGNVVGQQALLKALWWLKKVQNPDGSWGQHDKDAMTGLALLTFLAHGETTTSKNFGSTVRKAMEWLTNDPMNGSSGRSYGHAIKGYALAEAYAMTGLTLLEGSMNAAIRLVIDGMQKGGSYDYAYKTDEKRQDLSLAGWNYQALKAAYGAGCEEKGLEGAILRGIGWLKKRAATSNDGNGFPYAFKDGAYTGQGKHTMRAVGVLCLQLYGEGQDKVIADEIKAIAKNDLANYNWNNAPGESLYGWYYATQTMFQHGGNEWKTWNSKFQKVLTDNQHNEGYWVYPSNRGFHFAKQPLESLTAKVYATTLCALQLTVYYRYLPSTKGAIGGKAAKKQKKKPKEEEGLDLIE